MIGHKRRTFPFDIATEAISVASVRFEVIQLYVFYIPLSFCSISFPNSHYIEDPQTTKEKHFLRIKVTLLKM